MSNQYSALEILKKSTDFLSKRNLKSPKSDVEWIICHYLKIKKLEIYLDQHLITDKQVLDKIRSAVLRRSKREPLQHILGYVEFCNINLMCDRRALIPRFETEILVELIIKKLPKDFSGRITDFGTGSGAILVALAKKFEMANLTGLDKSQDSLNLAQENISLNKCEKNIELVQHNWHTNFSSFKKTDVLVSNPPYLSESEWTDTEPEVKNYDPREALISSNDGKSDVEKII